jgi:peptidoglycan hydrolase-like protein with peptidoglycan-binding domain
MAQNSTSTSTKTGTKQGAKRGPVFRATKDQINQAQAILKQRGFYAGEQIGKLDDATRDGLRKYQQAEGIKVTGTLNKVTLEKMNISLTEKQKTM